MISMPRAYAAVAAALLALALAACSSEEGVPKGGEPTTSAPTTSATPVDPVPPQLPEAAKAKTVKGAEAFVRYYWRIVEFSEANGTTEVLKTLQTDACDACTRGVTQLEEVFTGGAVFRSQPRQVRMTTQPMKSAHGESWVNVTCHVKYPGGTQYYAPDDARNIRQTPHRGTLEVMALWSAAEETWLINRMAVQL